MSERVGSGYEVLEGDCLEFLRQQPDGCFDITVTSPPYNQLGKRINPNERQLSDRHRDRFFQRMAQVTWGTKPEPEYQAWLSEIVDECLRVSKGLVWMNHKPRYRKGNGIHPRDFLHQPLWSDLVWDRCGSHNFHHRRFASSHEYVLGFGRPHWWDEALEGKLSVWRIPPLVNTGYPCQFPEELVEPIILASCPPDGIVFDPFMGAGTCAAVALRNGRRFVGCDTNPEAVRIALERIAGWRHKPVRAAAPDPEAQMALVLDDAPPSSHQQDEAHAPAVAP